MSKTKPRVVPWLCRTEFVETYECLYSESDSSRRRGVNTVALWRCRAHHKLPVAIDCTAVLVASALKHAESVRNDEWQTKEYELKLSHAMALIRLVNHITEKGQTKQYAQSVHMLAAEFGLPEWLVDLRHDATHGELPTLDLLSEGLKWALDWLHKEYWKKQLVGEGMDQIEVAENNSSDNNFIQSLLVNFMQVQFDCQRQQSSLAERETFTQLFSDMEQTFLKNKAAAVTIIVSDGYIIPTPDQLNAMGISQDTVPTETLELPEEITAFWKPVIQLLKDLEAIPLLLKALCETVTEDEGLTNRLRAGWIVEILKFSVKRKKKSTTCKINFALLIELCIAKPNAFTLPLLKAFGEFTDARMPEYSSNVLSLLKIYNGTSLSGTKDNSDCSTFRFHTVSDLTAVLTRAKRPQALGRTVPWQKCNDFSIWSCCPIGLLPHQKERNLTLDQEKMMKVLSATGNDSATPSTSTEEATWVDDTSISEEIVLDKEVQGMDTSEEMIPIIQLM